MKCPTLTTPCPSCLSAFKKAQSRMTKNKAFRDEVNELLDEPYQCGVNAKSTLQVIYEDFGPEAVARPVTMELPDLKVAPYYGCILNRPPAIANFDDPENPVSIDRLLEAVGVQVADFAFKLECCGAAFGVPKRNTVAVLTARVLSMALEAGANCVAVACPLCQQNLDLRQGQVNALTGNTFKIPVLYFSQIIGLTYGYTPEELGVDKCIVSAGQLLRNRRPKAGQPAGEGEAPVAVTAKETA